MWESPINVMHKQMQTQIEGNIMKAVWDVGVTVDKEELMKALKYDRDQYIKGYADGTREAIENILNKVDELKCKPIELCYDVPLYESIIQIIKEGLK